MSLHSDIDLVVGVYEPLVTKPNETEVEILTEEISTYHHKISAEAGFEEASISYTADLPTLEDWLENGLLRHIVIYVGSGTRVFEGFVNKLSLSFGPLKINRGPVLEISNQVWSIYAPLDTTVTPPTVGTRTINPAGAQSDTDSRTRYGLLQTALSAGTTTDTLADDVTITYLKEHKDPSVSQEVGDAGEPRLEIEIKGYWAFMTRGYYVEADSGTQMVSDATTGKLQAALTAARALNSWVVSSDYTKLTDNAYLAPQYDDEDMPVWDVITGLAALGGTHPTTGETNVRWTFGIYENRRAAYDPITTEFEYQMSATGQGVQVATLSGRDIYPWNVRPARWLLLSDFMTGRSLPTVSRVDPRAMFIESVEYDAPYGLRLVGGKVDTLKQKLEKMSLGGVSS